MGTYRMTPQEKSAAKAMRERCARECEDRLERVMLDTGVVRIPGTLKSVMELRGVAAAIRALEVNPRSPNDPLPSASPDDSASRE